MNVKLLLILILAYPARIEAWKYERCSENYDSFQTFKCPSNITICTYLMDRDCDKTEQVSCSSDASDLENVEQQAQCELTAINERIRNESTNGTIESIVFKFSEVDSISNLNLSLLRGFFIGSLNIELCSNLNKIVGGADPANILIFSKVKSVKISSNPKLDDPGLGDTLRAFSLSRQFEFLDLSNNSLTGNAEASEFLPGFSSLTLLSRLRLSNNKIEVVCMKHFYHLLRLRELHLDNNRIVSVRGSLLFTQIANYGLQISFMANFINENSFQVQSNSNNFINNEQQVDLNLKLNEISSLPQEVFYAFLRGNERNIIDVEYNPLICDSRLEWLNTIAYIRPYTPVKNVKCSNRQGASFFPPAKYDERTDKYCDAVRLIAPCNFDIFMGSKYHVICSGERIVQGHIDNVLHVSDQDAYPLCEQLHVSGLTIEGTKMTEIDVTFLFQIRLDFLIVANNKLLNKIKSVYMPFGTIFVDNLSIYNNPNFDDEGLGSILKHFSPQMVTLNLNGNKLRGTSNGEFLPGLSSLTNLTQINLKSNQIFRLSEGQFKNNSKLRQISLTGNKISKIGRHAFDFASAKDNNPIVIDLSFNLLNDDSFNENLFAKETSRPLNLNLSHNHFTTIPVAPFQNFLAVNSANQLNFEGNSLECDNRLEWTKFQDLQSTLPRILNAKCDGEFFFNAKGFKLFAAADDGILTIILSVVIPAVLILTLVAFYLWRKFIFAQNRLIYFSTKDIDDFRKGCANVDSHDPHAAIMSRPFDENLEIPRSSLNFDENDILGKGQYGIVLKGDYKTETGNLCVALKSVKTCADLETFKSLLSEIKILVFLGRHQNVVQLFGASTVNIRKRDVLAVLEFCQNGDLRSYILKWKNSFQNAFAKPSKDDMVLSIQTEESQTECENTLTTVQLLKFAMGIANGLKFLRNKNVIHGDLAARNVLLTDKLEAKISDFGLSRQLTNYQNYIKETQCPLPFKWMSIEAIKDKDFSICSDIWSISFDFVHPSTNFRSFGIVLYEIFSLGETPYPGVVVDQDFLPRLIRGYRMDKPEYADQQIYDVMLDTWKLAPLDRPSSEEIHCRLNQILDKIAVATRSTSYNYVKC